MSCFTTSGDVPVAAPTSSTSMESPPDACFALFAFLSGTTCKALYVAVVVRQQLQDVFRSKNSAERLIFSSRSRIARGRPLFEVDGYLRCLGSSLTTDESTFGGGRVILPNL